MIPPESFALDPAAPGTLQARLRQMIAQGILSGRFRPGERLPSSRALARHLGVSRITVTLAYTELVADDYLTAKGRSGYFVSSDAPEPPPHVPRPPRTGTVD
jgi:GntR family transcriptional regulator/MocR family aminotransferase